MTVMPTKGRLLEIREKVNYNQDYSESARETLELFKAYDVAITALEKAKLCLNPNLPDMAGASKAIEYALNKLR